MLKSWFVLVTQSPTLLMHFPHVLNVSSKYVSSHTPLIKTAIFSERFWCQRERCWERYHLYFLTLFHTKWTRRCRRCDNLFFRHVSCRVISCCSSILNDVCQGCGAEKRKDENTFRTLNLSTAVSDFADCTTRKMLKTVQCLRGFPPDNLVFSHRPKTCTWWSLGSWWFWHFPWTLLLHSMLVLLWDQSVCVDCSVPPAWRYQSKQWVTRRAREILYDDAGFFEAVGTMEVLQSRNGACSNFLCFVDNHLELLFLCRCATGKPHKQYVKKLSVEQW